ncbi:DinB family protein [Acidothermaceae bacterium B102]|nr:DinB family protein [Acidothermaceae bacterium B102]
MIDAAGRPEPPYDGDERATLAGYLDFQRATIAWKLAGLSDADAVRIVVPSSSMTLGGLVKHLIDVERYWFQQVLAGRDDVTYTWTDDDPDGDWRVEPAETVAVLLARYAVACDESRAVLAATSMEAFAHRGPTLVSVRWVVAHMIEETARHAGHADLLRELVDGVTGE